MSGHTPGPWKIDRSWGDTLFIKGGLIERETVVLVSLTRQDTETMPNGDMITRKTKLPHAEANAHLIEAAPDLLEACMFGRDAAAALLRAIKSAKTLADVMDNSELAQYNGFGVKMDAAIAKARGQ